MAGSKRDANRYGILDFPCYPMPCSPDAVYADAPGGAIVGGDFPAPTGITDRMVLVSLVSPEWKDAPLLTPRSLAESLSALVGKVNCSVPPHLLEDRDDTS